jgi:hypothetical protein
MKEVMMNKRKTKDMFLNRMIRIAFLLSILIVFGNKRSFGQEEDKLNGQNITVISELKAIIANADKIRFNPKLPPVEQDDVDLKYELPSHFISIPYNAPEVNPLAMKRQKLEPLKNVYATIGFGNYTTPYLDLYINSGRNNKYANATNNANLGLRVGYISSIGPLPDQNYSNLKTRAFGSFYQDAMEIGVYGQYDRSVYHFYGYDPAKDTAIAKADNKQVFDFISAGLRFRNAKKTSANVNYDGQLKFNYLTDYFKQNEINPVFDFSLFKEGKNGNAFGGIINIDHNTFSSDTVKVNNTIYSVTPAFRMKKSNWITQIGIFLGGDKDGFVVYPAVDFNMELVEKYLNFHAGFNGRIAKNNYKSLSDDNYFLNTMPLLANSRELVINAGFSGNPAQNLSYNISLNYTLVKYLPLFVTDTSAINKFNVVYDTAAGIFNPHLELGYDVSDKLRFVVFTDIYTFSLKNHAKAWYKPGIKGGLSVVYQVMEKLSTKADFIAYGSRWALPADGKMQKLSGFVDINLSATYKITDSFFIFANINNIASAKYQRWYNYPTYGINVIGGLKMVF